MQSDTLSDFPDRLSPMLVKELRQGLRAKTFVIVFLSFQALLSLILLSATASASSSSVGPVISSVIFVFFGIAVLVVQPLRGIGAISSEMKSNTLDMMVLTRLSTSRIVSGKWFALVSQSALILATVIPYLIFRYFLGEMNLIGEMVLLLLIFLTSMALTAVTVGLSANGSVILRVIFPLIGIPVLGWILLAMLVSSPFRGNSMAEMCSLTTTASRIGVSVFILALTYLAWSMLSMGVSMIAPAAENHATRRRLIDLAVTIVACILMVTVRGFDMDLISLVVALIATPAIATAVTERSLVAPTVDASFTKWGTLGIFAGIFLRPGWPSGIFFTSLLTLIFSITAFMDWMHVSISDEHQVQVMAVLGALLFPAVLTLRVPENFKLSAYLFILIASGIFSLILYAISAAVRNDELLWFFIWNPLTLIYLFEELHAARDVIPYGAVAVVGSYTVVLLLAAAYALKTSWQTPPSSTDP